MQEVAELQDAQEVAKAYIEKLKTGEKTMLNLKFTISERPENTQDYQTKVKEATKQAMKHMVKLPSSCAPCKISVKICHSLLKGPQEDTKINFSDDLKIILEGMRGIVDTDDSQVISLQIRTKYRFEPFQVKVKVEWTNYWEIMPEMHQFFRASTVLNTE